MKITTKYDINQMAYIVTDIDKLPRMITSIQIHNGGGVSYQLSCGTEASWHFEAEITTKKPHPQVKGYNGK